MHISVPELMETASSSIVILSDSENENICESTSTTDPEYSNVPQPILFTQGNIVKLEDHLSDITVPRPPKDKRLSKSPRIVIDKRKADKALNILKRKRVINAIDYEEKPQKLRKGILSPAKVKKCSFLHYVLTNKEIAIFSRTFPQRKHHQKQTRKEREKVF